MPNCLWPARKSTWVRPTTASPYPPSKMQNTGHKHRNDGVIGSTIVQICGRNQILLVLFWEYLWRAGPFLSTFVMQNIITYQNSVSVNMYVLLAYTDNFHLCNLCHIWMRKQNSTYFFWETDWLYYPICCWLSQKGKKRANEMTGGQPDATITY